MFHLPNTGVLLPASAASLTLLLSSLPDIHMSVCHCSKETVARHRRRQAAEQFHYSCLPLSPPVHPPKRKPSLSPLLMGNMCVGAVSKQLAHQAFLLSSPLSSFPSIPLPILFGPQTPSLSPPLCRYPVSLSLSPSSNRERDSLLQQAVQAALVSCSAPPAA